MLTTTSTSAPLGTATPGSRRQLRAPLHQIISYAEFILEDSTSNPDARVRGCLMQVIQVADACLKAINAPAYPTGSDRDPPGPEALSERLIQLHAQMEDTLSRLQALSEDAALLSLKSDLGKLHGAAQSFQQTIRELGEQAAAQPDTPSGPGSASLPLDGSVLPTPKTAARVEPLRGLILVVDDNEGNRDVLSRRLLRDGCEVLLAESGRQALRMVQRYDFDAILLDIMMPVMDGYAVLAELKKDKKLQQTPVIMISAVDEVESVVRCIELGADDYLYKPFNPVLLRARLRALLERNRLRQAEVRRTEELTSTLVQLKVEREKSDELLRNILPPSIAEELQLRGAVEPRYYEDVTIVFTDFVNFTLLTEELPTEDLVHILNQYFSAYDQIIQRHRLEKLKTIGDSYMFVGGMPSRSPSHPVDAVLAAMEMIEVTQEMAATGPVSWRLRVGIHTGPVAAGVVGTHKFAFDIWGDAVNLSSRMEASSEPDRINLSSSTYSRIKDFFSCEKRGLVKIKDGRDIQMYFVKTLASAFLDKQLSPVAAFRQRYRTYFQKDIEVPASLSAGITAKQS